MAAADAFDRSRALAPEAGRTLFLIGDGLAALGRRTEALAVFRELAARGNLELDLARRAAATLVRLSAWPDAVRLVARAGRQAGISVTGAMAVRYLRRTLGR